VCDDFEWEDEVWVRDLVIQAHGHFDLLHPGHIKHLLEAKSLGGHLVVTITSGGFMSKHGHPIFTDEDRALQLEQLRCVDEVRIIYDSGPYKAIDLVKPDIYVKGKEYEGRLPEERYCLDRGIEVKFLGEKIFGSTRLKSLLPGA
jgi:cytidyltransferase-like protein